MINFISRIFFGKSELSQYPNFFCMTHDHMIFDEVFKKNMDHHGVSQYHTDHRIITEINDKYI